MHFGHGAAPGRVLIWRRSSAGDPTIAEPTTMRMRRARCSACRPGARRGSLARPRARRPAVGHRGGDPRDVFGPAWRAHPRRDARTPCRGRAVAGDPHRRRAGGADRAAAVADRTGVAPGCSRSQGCRSGGGAARHARARAGDPEGRTGRTHRQGGRRGPAARLRQGGGAALRRQGRGRRGRLPGPRVQRTRQSQGGCRPQAGRRDRRRPVHGGRAGPPGRRRRGGRRAGSPASMPTPWPSCAGRRPFPRPPAGAERVFSANMSYAVATR